MDKIEKKIVTIWEQAFEIPANLPQAEEDALIERLMKPAAEIYLREYIKERNKKAKETRGRKPKLVVLTPEEEERAKQQKARLTAPMVFNFGTKEFLDAFCEDVPEDEKDK
jgi:hypothetical protein